MYFLSWQIAEMYKSQDQIQNQKKSEEKKEMDEEDFYWFKTKNLTNSIPFQ